MRAKAHTKFGWVRPHPTRASLEALAIGTRRPGRASPTHFEAETRVQRRAERLHVCLLLGSALRSEMAISGHQWPSVAISGHQWPSMAISGNQWQSVTTASGYQRGNSVTFTCGARREKGTTVRVSVGCSITCGEK